MLFKPLKQLKSLDLSENSIALLPNLVFKNNENTEVLNLSHNNLAKFNVEMEHMRKTN